MKQIETFNWIYDKCIISLHKDVSNEVDTKKPILIPPIVFYLWLYRYECSCMRMYCAPHREYKKLVENYFK